MNTDTTLKKLRTWPRDYNNTNRRINDVFQPFNRIEPRRTLSEHTLVRPSLNNRLLNFNLQPIRVDPLIQIIDRNNNFIDELANGIDNLDIGILRMFQPDWKFYLCATILTASVIWFSKEKIQSMMDDCKNWFSFDIFKSAINVTNTTVGKIESNKNVVDTIVGSTESDDGKISLEFGKKLIKNDTYFSPNWMPFLLPFIIIFKRK